MLFIDEKRCTCPRPPDSGTYVFQLERSTRFDSNGIVRSPKDILKVLARYGAGAFIGIGTFNGLRGELEGELLSLDREQSSKY